ncbi:hypothetical protein AO1008_08286 [Aspergillus oryzae 100-8]|uniref:F-box domain-containing protein n=1 Tax=Aspergillus oryzae (strain 3.042) TaxID=1160506 RepID=I8TP56_ASPO3|nr:hypothetical protein Ao3042_08415 [Aspergillus oryzae 3.042]KDE81993.1 hypothetical protein AO1008_08286 [Aspergillus oryzae 100-8]|eukprot:EIT75753.1 hypothetical protein Ao3042_08415 [Aspergillus oryzae 3.042]
MPQLLHLPGELLARVISHIDQSALKQLRQTCRTLAQFVSRELFRTVHLFPDEESYERVRNISNNTILRSLVRKIYINTCYKDSEWGDPDCTLTEPFKDAILQLKRFPNVQSTVLRFDKNCCVDDDGVEMWRSEWPQPPTYREEVLHVFFSWLTSLDVPTKELGICNLQDLTIKDTDTRAMMAKVLCGLQSLRLNIATEHHEASPEEDLEFPEPHEFFAEMPFAWLKPTMGSLEHLTIYCDNYWGFFPKLDLKGIHFPRLKTLALGNFGFAQDAHVEWIASHEATLAELYLDDCTILYDILHSKHDAPPPRLHPATKLTKRSSRLNSQSPSLRNQLLVYCDIFPYPEALIPPKGDSAAEAFPMECIICHLDGFLLCLEAIQPQRRAKDLLLTRQHGGYHSRNDCGREKFSRNLV